MIDTHTLESILKTIQKPGRYIGGEWNAVKKNPQKVETKIALVFPDLYEVGMSYLGQKILYSLINSHPSLLAERVFAPWPDFEKALRSKKLPLFSLENRIPLFQFDILGFSLLYELNYSNILTILDLGRIPFLSADRDMNFPLLIAGGPAAFNPEPLADMFDLFLFGDGEQALIEIAEIVARRKKNFTEKIEFLEEFSSLRGVYVPSLYKTYESKSALLAVKPKNQAPARIQKRILHPFEKSHFPEKIIVPNVRIIFDRVAAEISRGCPQNCRFCQAASLYFPDRPKDPNFLLENILKSQAQTGYEEVALAALSVSDYPHLEKTVDLLMDRLKDRQVALSLSSLRPKGLSKELVENILKVRKTGLTLVPEAGTERLRCVVNKNLSDEDIREAVIHAFSHGWKLLKLYFMIGLPTETEEDLIGIIKTVEEILHIGREILLRAPQVNLSISSFIPKPHTPFQWLAMDSPQVLEEKRRFLKSRLKKHASVRFKLHDIKNSILEGCFSRGDRKLLPVLIKAWENGARFDSWTDQFDFDIWKNAFQENGIDYRVYLAELDKESKLPWDFVDTGLKKSLLLSELEKAFDEKRTPACADRSCRECQGCSFPDLVERHGTHITLSTVKERTFYGTKADSINRFRIFYSKTGEARFVSHIDLNNIIQRTLRRADIQIVHSKGYHPKMNITYPPALPLGMEGKNELFEFKTEYDFNKKKFISRLNGFLPSGISFHKLESVDESFPSLGKALEKVIFSVDLTSPEINQELQKSTWDEGCQSKERAKILEAKRDEYLEKNNFESIEKISIDEKQKKLLIHLIVNEQKSVRPQDIAEEMLGITNAVFVMAREKIIFKEIS